MLAGSDGLEKPGLCVLTLTEKDGARAGMQSRRWLE